MQYVNPIEPAFKEPRFLVSMLNTKVIPLFDDVSTRYKRRADQSRINGKLFAQKQDAKYIDALKQLGGKATTKQFKAAVGITGRGRDALQRREQRGIIRQVGRDSWELVK